MEISLFGSPEINIDRLTEVLILLYVSYKTSHHVSRYYKCILS